MTWRRSCVAVCSWEAILIVLDSQPFLDLHPLVAEFNDSRIWVFAEWVSELPIQLAWLCLCLAALRLLMLPACPPHCRRLGPSTSPSWTRGRGSGRQGTITTSTTSPTTPSRSAPQTPTGWW